MFVLLIVSAIAFGVKLIENLICKLVTPVCKKDQYKPLKLDLVHLKVAPQTDPLIQLFSLCRCIYACIYAVYMCVYIYMYIYICT
jgi:hypothetical protein